MFFPGLQAVFPPGLEVVRPGKLKFKKFKCRFMVEGMDLDEAYAHLSLGLNISACGGLRWPRRPGTRVEDVTRRPKQLVGRDRNGSFTLTCSFSDALRFYRQLNMVRAAACDASSAQACGAVRCWVGRLGGVLAEPGMARGLAGRRPGHWPSAHFVGRSRRQGIL